jgi:hypothetical protein
MANIARPFGFRPERFLNAAPWNGQSNLYAFAAAAGGNAYKGDICQFDSTNRSTALTDVYAPGIQCITAPTAGVTTNAIRGVIVGFVPEPEFNQDIRASLGLMYRVASTARYAWVVDDYSVVFEVEEGGNSFVSATNNGINKTADITYTAGSQITGVSGVRIAGADFQTAAARPFRALRYTQRPDNFNFAAGETNSFAHMDVIIANSDLRQLAQGA